MTARNIPEMDPLALNHRELRAVLRAAELPEAPVESWISTEPSGPDSFASDRDRYTASWRLASALIRAMPRKAARNPAQSTAAHALHARARASRARFLQTHVSEVYAELTRGFSRFLRVDELVFAAADSFEGLTPTRAEIDAEAGTLQRDKDGLEIDQGTFLAHVLGDERCGLHFCQAMLLPRRDSSRYLEEFRAKGKIDLGAATIERRGEAAYVVVSNPRYLNAEDATTLDAMEIAVDVAILDPTTKIVVLRGGTVEHPKYAGQRIFGAGINLTHLYRGEIPFLWYLQRDLGYVHKIFRGVARPDAVPDDVHGVATEKPWIAAVDGFAIGGHCQALLVTDYVIAEAGAYLTLPARKEGIIPGAADLRLPRFVGDRIARQAIQSERRIECDSPEGRLICDEIARGPKMGVAIEATVARLASSGAVGAIANRRALRVGAEPLDVFRRYMAVYAREQAYCHFSPALIDNLERYWQAQSRT